MGQSALTAAPQAPISANAANTANYSAAQSGVQVKTGAGVLAGLSVNTGQSGGSVTLYDGTSTSGKKLGTWSAATQASLSFNGGLGIKFSTGLFAVVVSGGTAPDVTIEYY